MMVSKPAVYVVMLYCVATWCAAAAEAGSSTTNETATVLTNRPVTLAHALRTNLLGTYNLAPVWTGKCEVAVATGIFRNPERPVFATNRYALKFDVAVITSKNPVGHVGPKGIARTEKDGGYSALFTLRDSLPVNAELGLAERAAPLIKLLGVPQGFGVTSGQGSEVRRRLNWRFFSINTETNLETLEVTAMVEKRPTPGERHDYFDIKDVDGRIDSLEIVRGRASPEIKSPKKS
jgi:hypothetical protein